MKVSKRFELLVIREPGDADVSEEVFTDMLRPELPEQDGLEGWEWHQAWNEYRNKELVSIELDYDFRTLVDTDIVRTISLITKGEKVKCSHCGCDRWKKSDIPNSYLCAECNSRVIRVFVNGTGVEEGE